LCNHSYCQATYLQKKQNLKKIKLGIIEVSF
jgi:hypothetical protein